MNGLWQRAGDRMRDELGQVGYETWIGPLNFVAHQGSTVTVEAPNRFFRDWINERYMSLMRSALSAEAGGEIEVRLTLGENAAIAPPQQRPSNGHASGNGHSNGNGAGYGHRNGKASASNRATMAAAPRGDRHPTLNPRYSFAEFVVGSANQFAHAAAQAVANQPGEKYNPLFIYGGVGLGKTHLVTAIGHHIWASGERPRKVLFMPAEIFMNELIGSLRRDKMNEFREKFRRVDTLILDDVQFLAGRERTQEEFFHTFNALHAERHQIVLTSDKVPREIPGLEERLRNRFEMGLIADIAPPDLETRVAIVQKKAVLENLRLVPEVAMYIAQSVSSNVRELEGCLTRLAALASLNQSAITVDFARQALQDLIRNHDAKPDVESIQKTVADFFHIRLADLKSKKRTQHIAFCRQVAMYLCRKLTDSSFPTIGEHFGRDHSTVIHAYNLIMRRVTSDSAFRLSIEKIERELKSIRANAA
ncbi:MAG TPA: chromosomal replication initiator protein DnaA [Candidatus Binatus sp.]|uniref:chromosomal replication initiator protein DnaA n=1 Tax=Candidatus Binatus sp. TaxID=2811406 RepID=UPI002B490A87|nr:chromosomal replication initiator protein DnaA [Candidatus Binatus sp.]HKN11956.1 chromosomal replication initiator protein DnaA [Candidatus Binatus sp.]